MRVLARTAEAMGAVALVDIVSAHIDGCLYHGRAGVDFARRLVDGGASVVVPTTLNVGSVDLLHPELFRGEPMHRQIGVELMHLYTEMGCQPTFTCAPYQLTQRPAFGDQIAWAESNAVVFANSVLGARTERYGDFLDICAAVTGRAPAVGLHLDENRRAGSIVDATGLGDLLDADATYPLLGHVVGSLDRPGVPAIIGLPSNTSEDRLKALGAAGSASGSLAMFHAVGLTPEAPTLAAVAVEGLPVDTVDRAAIAAAARALTTGADRVDAVAVGTPHYSHTQMVRLAALLEGAVCRLPFYVNTGREVLERLGPAAIEALARAGVTIVTDTCTYITPILDPAIGVVMTDSAKWAYYAPANLGVDVVFGSVDDCVRSAVEGRLVTTW